MVNLKNVNKTKKAYVNSEHELLIIGIHKGKQLTSKQRLLDSLIDNKLSKAIELDSFDGKINIRIMIYGNDSIKRVVLIGLGDQKQYKSYSFFKFINSI